MINDLGSLIFLFLKNKEIGRQLALSDLREGNISQAHGQIGLNQGTATCGKLANTLADHVDELLLIGNNF